ncbi:PDZ domain-containing protein [Haloferax mediterranei ATCC 33500]|uniref:Membrane-associated Zn-dependent protease n=1 Tax=Haloferax mediterranei (strain ATCC 33500 / DSM 1411 / JCM 8866 / NBRC 14739 / NCIMB 2177 / R-4) TaxID=523841 RepID=I3R5Y8_HALMT|nr:site-2 protease family protein [Haloferax mediterranei]AFK19648.2 putative membrane-associated Zn-dependent protease [Haloferax mediterranei ATCC 33500]AHZ23036.1 metalloprotease [Haloferax mediterranei ATCC 33500]ELZ99966.1 putative membrane-associated Zn-dependent protease [Haloferax mediterranei ATCC 33500]MDX5987612.1 site-2 protease family protein [Haloferax mediterranei ATCC 33500]QCQ74099.1 PDZ domain-containing protein [Haloferax mediterranei ATCC 33500]
MNTLQWILAGFIAYSLLAALLRARGVLPEYIRVQGPLMTVHTRRGRELLDKLASPKRFWRAWSNIGLGVALVIMVGSFVLLVYQAVFIVSNPPAPTQVNQPQNFLVIPGVNDFLPLSVAPEILFGLLVGLVVHEGGHGVLSRVEGIDVESMGVVLLTILPVGAFVEPSEESQRRAERGGKSRMFAAGVTNNFAVTVVAFALLFGPVIGSISVAPGVAVSGAYSGSPADVAGISSGDRVTAIEGTPVNTTQELDAALLSADDQTVTVELDGERTVSVTRELVVAGSVSGNPANLTVESGGDPLRVTAVNGTPVSTQAEFEAAVGDSRFVRLDTSVGERTIPVGAYITNIAKNESLFNAVGTTDPLIITALDGARITSSTDLQEALDRTEPTQTVPVEVYRNGSFQTYDVTLGENPQDGNGFLGVNIFPGTSGLLLTDFGTQEYPAGTYLSLLGGDGGDGSSGVANGLTGSPLQLVYVSLLLPLASVVLGIPNFPGFTGDIINFYQVGGPLGFLGGGVFLLANLLFWTAWINLQLGLFNCIPGYPLDGGRILRTAAEAVVSRLPVDDPHTVVRTITTSIGLTMLASLLLMIFGPTVLGG